MSMDAPISPEDTEAARLLRDMAGAPRQSIIWVMHHGRWSGNTMDAFQRGANALAATGNTHAAAKLTWLGDHAGLAASTVLKAREWPSQAGLAMLDAAAALVPDAPEQ